MSGYGNHLLIRGQQPRVALCPGDWYVLNPTNNSSEFWIFGGQSFDSAGTNGNGLLRDLWRYLPYP